MTMFSELMPRHTRILCSSAAVAAACSLAPAQLRPDETLVVYDSRLPQSREVAEFYAGSRKVPGGAGTFAGSRPGVWVLDLATTGAPATAGPDIAYADFITRVRNPIRAHLTSQNLSRRIRCLVMTRGLPHRIQDIDFPTAGDAPGQLVDELNANDATCAALDAELTLLWQDLSAGEAGGSADSKADGLIQNPYWKLDRPIWSYSNANAQAAKTYTANGVGPVWLPSGTAPARLTPGDVMLVSRLDGNSFADVQAIIGRAKNLLVNPAASVAVIDESDSDGVANPAANGEFDNSASGFPNLWAGDDYELTRDDLLADARFGAAFVRYNGLTGGNQFSVGPRLSWQPPVVLISEPVVLLTHFGSNHSGVPRDAAGNLAHAFYATSFNYANGAIFNTLESYNGRAFGGLGQPSGFVQQQLADFLAAGGTFGIGHTWEPIADSLPDSRYLAQNFLRGNLSWAETAWSSIPALSWMQVVVGDPLARAQRSTEDVDGNGRVDANDLYAWEASPTDVNRSGVADAADRTLLMNSVRAGDRAGMLAYRN